MTEELRALLYPLGYIASVFFMGRFMVQWLQSEYYRKSVVPRLFWQISFVGNILLLTHALIQVQYTICLVQATNSILSWRNLNLMNPPEKQARFRTVVCLLAFVAIATTTIFIVQGIITGNMVWMRVPLTGWNSSTPSQIPMIWHLFGTTGIFLFSARFWIQWWCAEKQQASTLGSNFWWLSLAGAVLMVLYFYQMGDIVNMIGPGLGTIPYLRNLMLLRKERKAKVPMGNQ